MVDLKVKFKGPKGGLNTLSFHDSLNIVEDKLENLAITSHKLKFPHLFMDSIEKIDYVGAVPDAHYWPDKRIPDEFLGVSNWVAKDHIELSLTADINILFEFLMHIGNMLAVDYNLNINIYATTPGMSVAIYRSKFYDRTVRSMAFGVSQLIESAYRGGATEVYKPVLLDGYYYDINSLYPFCMQMLMPVGNMTKINGPAVDDIQLANFFGFLLVDVNAPADKIGNIPLLTYKRKPLFDIRVPAATKRRVLTRISGDDDGVALDRILYPHGAWRDIYFSEELKYAEKLGYSFKIIEAYPFDSGTPFVDFVNTFYQIKQTAKLDVVKKFAKLVINTFYGKLAAKRSSAHSVIMGASDIADHTQINGVSQLTEVRELSENSSLYQYTNASFAPAGISNIALAAAITAYGRIQIHKYKTIPGNTCYYSDTDSVFLEKPLDPSLVGPALGQMKLVSKVKKAIFLGPKSYVYVDESGKSISKISGYGAQVSIDTAAKLLYRKQSPIELPPYDTFDVNKGMVRVARRSYTLKLSDSKRKRIFDSNDYLIDTAPITINDLDSVAIRPYSNILDQNIYFEISPTMVDFINKARP